MRCLGDRLRDLFLHTQLLELFLELNGHRVTATDDELFDLVIAVATRELDTVQEIAERLARLVR